MGNVAPCRASVIGRGSRAQEAALQGEDEAHGARDLRVRCGARAGGHLRRRAQPGQGPRRRCAHRAPHFEPLAAAKARRRVVRAGAAVWAATLVLWAFFLFVIASKLGQKDATVAEKKAAQRDRRRRTTIWWAGSNRGPSPSCRAGTTSSPMRGL